MRIYEIVVNGQIRTVQLSDADAARLDAKPVEKSATPANKARTVKNKAGK